MDNLEEKIGQMVIIRMFGKEITEELIEMIRDYKVGGIILYSRNYDSYEEMMNLVNQLKELNKKYNKYPLFISTDQEGGRVNRMPREFKNINSASKLISNESESLVEEAGRVTGCMLNISGFNMNFAPVLDIQRFDDTHAIGDRCFGKLKEDVSRFAIPYMKAMKNENVISVVKHFPGHGATKKDSHFLLPIVTKPLEELERDDMEPFVDAINNGADAIMVSHIIISKVDKLYPASISRKFIKEYLKDKYDYKGLIITDDLKMKSISILYGYKRAFTRAIFAQNDIVMIGATYDHVKACINEAKKMINKSAFLQKQVDESFEKIISKKEEYGIKDDKVEMLSDEAINKLNKRIEEINSRA